MDLMAELLILPSFKRVVKAMTANKVDLFAHQKDSFVENGLSINIDIDAFIL